MDWTSILILIVCMGAWILYELYGSTLKMVLRLVGGAIAVGLMLWYASRNPEEAFGLVKDMVISNTPHVKPQTEKRNVSGLMKKKIAASQQWKCGSCSSLLDETYEVDHRLALYKGGSNDPSNLVALCPNCHRKKTVDERLN